MADLMSLTATVRRCRQRPLRSAPKKRSSEVDHTLERAGSSPACDGPDARALKGARSRPRSRGSRRTLSGRHVGHAGGIAEQELMRWTRSSSSPARVRLRGAARRGPCGRDRMTRFLETDGPEVGASLWGPDRACSTRSSRPRRSGRQRHPPQDGTAATRSLAPEDEQPQLGTPARRSC
jgi:hypothetical protein